jgi:hypothetical protein
MTGLKKSHLFGPVNDTSIEDLPLIITISDTFKNHPKRLDFDNTINLSSLIVSLTVHSGGKKTHDWVVDVGDPVSLVLDLRVVHDRVDSSTDPTLNAHLHYPNNLDQSLNDTVVDKKRRYRPDYSNNPTRGVGFMPPIVITSGRLHSEFIRILFLQTHWETDFFFAVSGVLSVQPDRGFFHYRHRAFSSMLKSRVGNILDKATVLRINLNIDGTPIASKFLLFSF